jgi:hypothetical protein
MINTYGKQESIDLENSLKHYKMYFINAFDYIRLKLNLSDE